MPRKIVAADDFMGNLFSKETLRKKVKRNITWAFLK